MNDKVLWGAVVLAFILSIVFYPFLPADMVFTMTCQTVRIHQSIKRRPDFSCAHDDLHVIQKKVVQLFLVVYCLLIVHIAVMWLAL